MKLLLVEDNAPLREQMKWALSDCFEILEADSAKSCIDIFSRERPPIVCLDMGLDNMPDKGLECIDALLGVDRRCKVVVITAHTSEALGTEAIGRGAFDYLRKPIDIEELKGVLARASRIIDMEPRPESTPETAVESGPDFQIIGECPAMQRIYQAVRRLSQTDVSVLITGESGTGKELCARAIHVHSQRSSGAFVPINCGAIPETLLESELFGYARGAFTGAAGEKKGLVESADGGTLFLDEIGDMPSALQVKLLRFLEDQRYQRLGDVTLRQANVRIVAATNRRGINVSGSPALRTDLYYRLSEFEIHLPPLRERGDDVLLLARAIVERNRVRFNQQKLSLSPRAENTLRSYSWPGNVRELENKLSRAAISCVNQTIEPGDLELSTGTYGTQTLREARESFEREYVAQCLKKAEFNISEAAKAAGVSRPTFYDLMKRLGISIRQNASLEGI